MNEQLIVKRAYTVYRNSGSKVVLMQIIRKIIFDYIKYLNRKKMSKEIQDSKRVVKMINGSKMYLDTSIDDGLCRYLVISDVREGYILETMEKELEIANVVVDIGANVGYYALLEAKIIGNKGKIYAIEPVPETNELLKENVKLNNYENVEIYQQAIGDKTGVATMYVSEWLNRSQMKELGLKNEKVSHEVNVPISTLDDFMEDKPYPDIIRMDTEGYEYNILKGMQRILETKKALSIFMEFHFRWLGKGKSIELLRILKNANFEIADATYETDEKCITNSDLLGNLANYVHSKLDNLPFKGHLRITIDDILSNAIIWNNKEGALDLCFRLGALEIFFKRSI
jgi:FkbM family methyltransferase